ncbi:MAG TPA: phytochelatin synthase family protein [Polyangiaceae bacterium]|nr:phytochelatin synthase family protein [Polyangiaceae bacterium]
MSETLYRRPLPSEAIAFSSLDGRKVFAEALATGGLDGYFPLAEQFHTQSDPAFCGLGSLVVSLNALGIDPGRLWKGPWRWFSEELLDCCVPLAEVRKRGLDLEELACLARCNGADVQLVHGDAQNLAAFRAAIASAAGGEGVLVACYDRSALGQTGSGHFSPIGGYHRARDLALILDVARFKYPPHWISVERLWQATHALDPATGRARGWLVFRPRAQGIALGFSIRCDGESWEGFAQRLSAVLADLNSVADIASFAQAIVPLVANLELRMPSAPAHREAVLGAQAALRDLPLHRQIAEAVGAERAETVTLLMLAIDDILVPPQRFAFNELTQPAAAQPALASEVSNIRAQLAALWTLGDCSPRAPTDGSRSPQTV